MATSLQECDGTGPDSPTHGCRPRAGHYVWGDGGDPGVNRKCGCLFNDEVVGHEQLSLQSQCKLCDVAQSNVALVDQEEDSVCDPTLESAWRGTKDEFCMHSHVCKSGACTGIAYSCPAIGVSPALAGLAATRRACTHWLPRHGGMCVCGWVVPAERGRAGVCGWKRRLSVQL